MIIDLRSDTVTKPSKGMLEAMFNAAVGDDVFGEDPTVIKLEKKIAKLFNKESALFCPSGTMTNQIAIKVQTQPGDELLCDATSHIYNYEGAGISFNSGVQAKLLCGKGGQISSQQILENINQNFDWLAHTSLVCIENTANRAGGSYYSLAQMQELSKTCNQNKLKLHLDGARIFNAIVEIPRLKKISKLKFNDQNNSRYNSQYELIAQEIGGCFNSISVCLSKGLGAPIGSLLLGNAEFINKARRVRKVFGGGMRQAGYLAAAGIYALDNNIKRLNEDHKRAKYLSNLITEFSYVDSVLPVNTNIIIFNLNKKIKPDVFIQKLAKNNIKAVSFGKNAVRFLTHLDFTDDMLEKVEKSLKNIF